MFLINKNNFLAMIAIAGLFTSVAEAQGLHSNVFTPGLYKISEAQSNAPDISKDCDSEVNARSKRELLYLNSRITPLKNDSLDLPSPSDPKCRYLESTTRSNETGQITLVVETSQLCGTKVIDQSVKTIVIEKSKLTETYLKKAEDGIPVKKEIEESCVYLLDQANN